MQAWEANDALAFSAVEGDNGCQSRQNQKRGDSSMPTRVTCPGCGKPFSARDDSAGKRVKCPSCRGWVSVPAEDSDEAKKSALRKKQVRKAAERRILLIAGTAGGALLLLLLLVGG